MTTPTPESQSSLQAQASAPAVSPSTDSDWCPRQNAQHLLRNPQLAIETFGYEWAADVVRGLLESSTPPAALDQQANAWQAVCQALDECVPEWCEGSGVGQDMAVAAIRAMARHGAQPAALVVTATPDPRGVHVAVHQGQHCVHAEVVAQPAASAEPLAVLRYERATPGRENEMPRVLSCNRLPDGEYRVYLSPVAAQARPTEKCGVLPPLPPYSDALLAKAPTAIEKFVADHEPAGDDDEPFRTQLEAALQQAFDLGLAAQASGQAQDAVAHQFSIEGVVHFKRSDPAEQVCVCCPQGGGHIFSRGVHWDAWETGYPEHFGNGANVLVMRHATDLNANEGKRVRLTVEVLDAARQENGNAA
ncbi:hypothetical protein [Orrella dioscoreae]|uniref:hypothetical protein n=1 Tax=Orrella dioscoreae TaxID=1851544 RepID=UPI000BEF6973|nr:hypothetical protein [Orrella dioscoreae]